MVRPPLLILMATFLGVPGIEAYGRRQARVVFAAHDPSARNHVLAVYDACRELGKLGYVDLSLCDFGVADWAERVVDGLGPYDVLVVGCSSNGCEFRLVEAARRLAPAARTAMVAELGLGRPGVARLAGLEAATAPDLVLVTNERAAESVRAKVADCGARSDVSVAGSRPGQEKGAKLANFKGSYLGRFPLVSADFSTNDHPSERYRSVNVFSGTRARGTTKLKRR